MVKQAPLLPGLFVTMIVPPKSRIDVVHDGEADETIPFADPLWW